MFGFYRVGQYNQDKREQKALERRARYAIAPILQAEADREYVERELILMKKESEIMKKSDPNWVVGGSTYHSGKFMPRAINVFSKFIQ